MSIPMQTPQAVLPSDIKRPWLNVIRRLQSVARQENQGYAILSITVLVDQDGCPVVWTEPSRKRLEPKSNEEILRLLSENDSGLSKI